MLLNPGSNQHLISVRQGKDPHNSVVNKLHTYRISLPEASVCRLILNSHLHSIILLYLSTIRAGCDKSTVRMLWIFHSLLWKEFFISCHGFNFLLMKYIVNGLKMNCVHFFVCNSCKEVNNETFFYLDLKLKVGIFTLALLPDKYYN